MHRIFGHAPVRAIPIANMTEPTSRKKQAKLLRIARSLHRTTGAVLFIFFFVVSVTGLLLGWKKNSGGVLLAKSYQGTTADLKKWLPVDSLHTIACTILHDSVSADLALDLERIDIRKDKGMVKFVFADSFWGIQLDGATGKLLHIERRRADYVEKIHDGSIIDHYLGFDNGAVKLVYSTVMGVALLLFTITGFWLWYGPKRMRKDASR
ncbi:PepSY domain-containing protein [Fibrella aquatica]|uniref:PepSY domain-containing protein n=1 Tax=Fibrella aquatica TaxID=3242487 RepID=UPI00352262E1